MPLFSYNLSASGGLLRPWTPLGAFTTRPTLRTPTFRYRIAPLSRTLVSDDKVHAHVGGFPGYTSMPRSNHKGGD